MLLKILLMVTPLNVAADEAVVAFPENVGAVTVPVNLPVPDTSNLYPGLVVPTPTFPLDLIVIIFVRSKELSVSAMSRRDRLLVPLFSHLESWNAAPAPYASLVVPSRVNIITDLGSFRVVFDVTVEL